MQQTYKTVLGAAVGSIGTPSYAGIVIDNLRHRAHRQTAAAVSDNEADGPSGALWEPRFQIPIGLVYTMESLGDVMV
jgi:hypothetical protein